MTAQGDIEWDNGSYWENKNRLVSITKPSVSVSSKMDNQMHEQKEEAIKPITNSTNTEQVQGEMEDNDGSDVEDSDHDHEFEQDFDSYFKDQHENEDENQISLEIKNDAHFVLINDDELFDVAQNKEECNNDQVDEWLMV
eukprot:CAMPEP_0201593098 /NCGR_PEP_ID=MMETSP0190_2-20130828/190819_1 /ASSEMBLY_ACC=CAM_ASM_000263 /TAXON_ID=37353 /ORGANISM="Rosalina sp." /LENGTH=139 /DNA_ID=CAMNT_0048052179 /DNA_START=1283 /DNA_END=1702 /DNA_ORIENTATION=-